MARSSCPPSLFFFSYRVTSWPLSAATLAASIPAGPPPITRTLFFFGAGAIRYSRSRLSAALTEHCVSMPCIDRPLHPPHVMQGLMSSSLPEATLLGISGSAKEALPITTRSVLPSRNALSPASGVIRPATITGTLTAFFMPSAKCT